jgi:hypothetical protein
MKNQSRMISGIGTPSSHNMIDLIGSNLVDGTVP